MIPHRLQKQHLQCYFRRFINTNTKIVKVAVKQGVVVGKKRQLASGLQFDSFLGVPYAIPPLGILRYKSPIPLQKFDVSELDCSKERDVSHQRDPLSMQVVGSEDCLYLNIYVPQKKQSNPLPVMVWIYGGKFKFGNGNSDYTFPERLMEEDVIVVTLNYRLSVLGFLCLPEEGIFGNAGLKDQRLALQWVQDNIHHFNGDPGNITLFGESAGAVSVHMHTYARHANKLFHKAIMQTGCANMEWVIQQESAYKTRRLAELLGYSFNSKNNTTKLLDFLQSKQVTPLEILAKSLKTQTAEEIRRCLSMPFVPVIEDSASLDSFIDEPIMDLLNQKNRVGTMPMIMGYNSAEGITFLGGTLKKLDQFENDFECFVPRAFSSESSVHDIAVQIRDFYLDGKPIGSKSLDSLADLLGDYHFIIDIQHAARIHVRQQPNSPLYFYRFDYVGDRNNFKKMSQFEHLHGATHADELFYLFQTDGDNSLWTESDKHMSKRICQLWANFARSGNPSTSNCSWAPVTVPDNDVTQTDLDYLILDKQCEMKRNPDINRYRFWHNIYKHYKPNHYSHITSKL